jgi:hypothetical protein
MTTSNTGERLYRGTAPATARSGVGPRRNGRRAAIARWLGGDGGWPRFERAGAPDARAIAGADLARDLERWRVRLARRHALIVARRRLLVAAALALAILAALALAGGDQRSPWLLAPLAVGALAAAGGRPGAVTLERTASMLDRHLGLRDRVATALELSRGGARVDGLGALVLEEARAALGATFGGARLRLPRARVEWAALLVLAVAIGLLIGLPAERRAGSPSRPATAVAKAHPGAGGRAGSAPPAGTAPDAVRPGAALPSNGAAPARGDGAAGARRPSAQQFEHDAGAAARNPAPTPVSGAGQPRPPSTVFRSGGRGANVALPGQFEAVPTRGGSAGGGLAAPNEVSGGAVGFSPTSAPVSAAGQTRSGSGTGTGRGHGVAASSGAPGGTRAGDQPGGTALRPAAAPDVAHSSVGLPLQAGYAPSGPRGTNADRGVSQIPDGGSGASRTVQVDGGTTTGGAFAVIPPSSDAVPTGETPQLGDYFGVANQQDHSRW